MAQKVWIKISGSWKEVTNVWEKISGTWQGGVKTYIKANNVWEACFDDGFNEEWDGYIVWSFDYEDSGTLHFIAYNASSIVDDQSSQMFWESRDIDDEVIDSGSVTSGTLDHGESSYPTDAITGEYVTIWGKTSTSQWNQIY